MPRPILRVTFLLAAALALAPDDAAAFDYAAHCRMSNRAFRMAVRRVEGDLDPRRRQLLRALADSTRDSLCDEKARGRTRAYGEWVAQVDWALSPADFFLTPAPGVDSTRTDSIPTDALAQLVRMPLQDFRVLHENSEHFGAHALLSFRLWHRRALEEAGRGNVEVALVLNAFADHYLQDLFAPGHLFSPRMGLNDVLTGGIHNAYNRRGAYYHPANTGRLAAYLADPAGVADRLDPSLDSLVRATCAGAPADECMQALMSEPIPMFGDYQLGRSPRQELFVTLVMARSVEDVLREWVAGRGEAANDSFQGVRWCGYSAPSGTSGRAIRWISPSVETPFGRFRQEEGRGLPSFQRWLAVRAGFANRLDGPGGYWELSAEQIWRAKPAGWLGADGGGTVARLRDDRATYGGFDLRIPTDGGMDDFAAGPFVRGGTSLNRVNARLLYVAGLRVRPEAGSFEPHAGGSFEVGFGLLHLELRPSLAWNARDRWEPTLLSGASIVFPRKGKSVPATPELPPSGPPGVRGCETNTVLVP